MNNLKLSVLIGFAAVATSFAQTNEIASVEYTTNKEEVRFPIRERRINKLDPSGFKYGVKNLKVNTPYTELTNHLYKNKFIYSSSKKIGVFKSDIDPKTNEPYKLLFCGDIAKDQEIKHSTFFSNTLNTDKSNETFSTFTEDEETVYFTRSVKEGDQELLKIFRATLERGAWKNIEMLSFNMEGFEYDTPYVSPNGDKLFFASNMPGTIGGYDIYVVNIDENGKVGTPRNLGNEINTSKDEKYPYMMGDDALYFASSGHYGLGGYDIFESKFVNNRFYFPTNMGSSINSISDDFGFLINKDDEGYFTSDRTGGQGGYDIYAFKREKIKQYVDIQVLDENGAPLISSKVLVKDSYNRVIADSYTDENGMMNIEVMPYNSYAFYVNKKGYNDNIASFEALDGDKEDYTYTETITMTEKSPEYVEVEFVVGTDEVFFANDKFKVSTEIEALQEALAAAKDNAYEVIINAHADQRFTSEYNMTLSQKRGEFVKAFLIENGVKADIISVKAFGETKPRVTCDEDCSKEELKENRRVEIIIKKKEMKEVKQD
ncbi:OmpA family protein [Pustulibacterium marinum]|nr:OmpA family protein [Pustulibacterium marinum]